MTHLQIITASTREGRSGHLVASWFESIARKHDSFHIETIDLAEVDLPVFNEPRHPRFAQYEHDHTKEWSSTIARADAFVFVTPEYDHVAPASLINAMQYLVREWAYKPLGFVSYGGVSGGTRGAQVTKQIAVALRMMPIPEAVHLPFFKESINEDEGVFEPDPLQAKAADAMLAELLRWAEALKPLRTSD